jgi:hypothetical protein
VSPGPAPTKLTWPNGLRRFTVFTLAGVADAWVAVFTVLDSFFFCRVVME